MIAYIRKSSLHGEISLPTSKSHTIRGVLVGMLADGVTEIINPLCSEDCFSAIRVAKAYGAQVEQQEGRWLVYGTGGNLSVPEDVVNTGNSGMTTCIIIPVAGVREMNSVITGDWQIRKRPLQNELDAMTKLGATAFSLREGSGSCPVFVRGKMKSGEVHMEGEISEHVTGMLFAAPLLDGETVIHVNNPSETPYLDMTTQWLNKAGIQLTWDEQYRWFKIPGFQQYKAFSSVIPGDWSAAAFPLVAAVCTDSEYIINGIDYEDIQGDKAIVEVLRNMGADITVEQEAHRLVVVGGKPLHGSIINLRHIPDTFPALAVAAAYAVGDTKFLSVKLLRYKETDRASIMSEALEKMGITTIYDETDDSLTVKGTGRLKGAVLKSYDDHRIAMALSVAGMIAEGETVIHDAEAVAVTFPTFYQNFIDAGAQMKISDGILTNERNCP